MRVSFNLPQQLRLVDEYDAASQQIDNSLTTLAPLLTQAYELLGVAPPPAEAPASLLASAAEGLRHDRTDLQRRGEFLVEADATLALRIAEQAGAVVNIHLAQQALDNGWTYHEAELRLQLKELRELPTERQIQRGREIRLIEETLRLLEAPHSIAGVNGDLDANFDQIRVGRPLRITSDTPEQRGRDLIIRALNDTADPDAILRDEFEAIIHDNGNLTLVLPGVIDLSTRFTDPKLGFGLDDDTNSLRDLDQEAFTSARSTLAEDNGYALRVAEWVEQMIENGAIEPGTKTTIVGHSFGGDTALDLTADPYVNGVLLNITHVYSAAYHNEPQFKDLPAHTSVVVAQNIYDIPVFVEELAGNTNAIFDGNPENMAHGFPTIGQVGGEVGEEIWNGMSWLVNETFNEIEDSVVELHDIHIGVPDIPSLDIGDQYFEVADNILLVQFEGGIGLTDFGHHQDHYTEHVRNSTNPTLLEFAAELDAAGFTADGTTISIDVTDPDA